MRALYVAPFGLILLAVLWFFRSDDDEGSAPDGAVVLLDAGVLEAGIVRDGASLEPLAEERASARRRSREEAAELRAAIEAARSERVREASAELAAGSAGGAVAPSGVVQVPPEEDAERLGRLDPQYIRDAIRELQPLFRECYELALEENRRQGASPPEGRLVTRFVIGGEPEVGGVIEESEVMEDSELRHPLLEECFTQTLFTVELPAPEEGGRVTVHYPFVFRSAAEAE